MARIVIHEADAGLPPAVYVEGTVEVIWVSDHAPEDRFYRMSPAAIPPDLLREIEAGPMGYAGDDPAKHARAHRAAAEIGGDRHLSVVPEDLD